MPSDILSGVTHKAIEEGKRLFWIFLYLWVLLGLFRFTKLSSRMSELILERRLCPYQRVVAGKGNVHW